MSNFPTAQETAFADFVQALRNHTLEAERFIHAEGAVAIVKDLMEKLQAINAALPPPPTPQLAQVVPLPEPTPTVSTSE